MNALFPTWALGQNGFTTSPGPGSPGAAPSPAPSPAPAPSPQQRPVQRFPYPYDPYYAYNPYNPYYPYSGFSPYSPYQTYDLYSPYRAYYPLRPYRAYYPEYAPAPRVAVAAGPARRLLDLAERAERVIDSALRRADARGATARDRAAADEVRECLDDLTRAAGRFGRILAELRAAVDNRRPAGLSLDQVEALETFAECAERAEERGRA